MPDVPNDRETSAAQDRTSIYIDDLSGHEVGQVRRQKQDWPGNFFRGSCAAQGIAAATIFCPALVSSTALDISVATHPGATELTRMLWRASSLASPLVRLIIPPFEAP